MIFMSTGILPLEELKRKCHSNTGFFETSQTTEDAQMFVTSGNHDSAGLSIGNLQYNYGAADRAQEWFKYMVDNQRAIVDAAFGANITERDKFITVTNTYVRADRITWGDSISALVNGEKRALVEPYKSAFGNMLISAEGKAKYYAMADTYYWTPIYEVFRHVSCDSRMSIASLFDTYVNKGRYYPINLIQADFDRIDADTTIDDTEKERQKIYAINYRGNYDNAVKPTPNAWDGSIDQETFWHGDGVDDGRRGCMANQEGVYYGAVYDPDVQFDMNQEPATAEKAGAQPLNVNLGSIAIDNAYLGTTPIKEIYLGATLIGGGSVTQYTSTRVPTTQFRTNAGSYAGIGAVTAIDLAANAPLWIDVQEPFVGCRSYYTTDGSTPTTASTLYTDALKFTQTTVLKVLTVSVFGVAAAVKTLTVNVAAAATGWRYLKIEGYGAAEVDQTVTTRLVEFEAWESATNRMTGATILSGETPSNAGTGGALAQIKDGSKTGASNTYPLWWTSPTPNGNVIIDLLAQRALTKLNYYGYSLSGVQRTNRFKILASNTNNGTDWQPIWDNSAGQAGVQPILPAGYEKVL
jgi:hypothetical protein